ncbi:MULTISPECIES: hypothetical protein [unclassified Streptomyces]|uniref:hypothetical protein n=1 Tax=unclassified Streptomyces TaxID=2593676 RepID=UPI0035DD825C
MLAPTGGTVSAQAAPDPSRPPDPARTEGLEAAGPPVFDSERYKNRSTVERAINRLKGFQGVVTRYEKRAYIYLGTVTLASLAIRPRT